MEQIAFTAEKMETSQETRKEKDSEVSVLYLSFDFWPRVYQ